MAEDTNTPKLDITPTEKAAIELAVNNLYDVHSELSAVGHLLYELCHARYQAGEDSTTSLAVADALFGGKHIQENITIALASVNEAKRLLRRDLLKQEVPDAPEMPVQHPA